MLLAQSRHISEFAYSYQTSGQTQNVQCKAPEGSKLNRHCPLAPLRLTRPPSAAGAAGARRHGPARAGRLSGMSANDRVDGDLRARARSRAGYQLACGTGARGQGEQGDMRARATRGVCEARTSDEDRLHVPPARSWRVWTFRARDDVPATGGGRGGWQPHHQAATNPH